MFSRELDASQPAAQSQARPPADLNSRNVNPFELRQRGKPLESVAGDARPGEIDSRQFAQGREVRQARVADRAAGQIEVAKVSQPRRVVGEIFQKLVAVGRIPQPDSAKPLGELREIAK